VTRTQEVQKYVQDVGYLILHQRIKPLQSKRLRIDLFVYPPDNKRRDLDNICKAVLDALQHANVFADDFYIQQLYVERCTVRMYGEIEFTLTEL
jgi:crossover junction endodeoxyribonuclease RusA